MRNKLITKRDGQSYDWLAMDTYFDAFITDPDYNRNFSNLYNDLKWSPLPWFNMNLETQFPVIDDGSGFSEVAARANFMPNENIEFSIGHRWLDNHPVLTDSQRLDLRTALASSTDGRSLTLAVGAPADLAVLDVDPDDQVDAPGGLRAMPVAGTLLAGRWTHRTF